MDKYGNYDWDDEINDVIEGNCDFEVTNVKFGNYGGTGKKIKEPCRKAVVSLKVWQQNDMAYIKTSFIFHESVMWSIRQFFESLGMEAADDPESCDWEGTVGKRGKAYLTVRQWTDENGNINMSNSVKYFTPQKSEAYYDV